MAPRSPVAPASTVYDRCWTARTTPSSVRKETDRSSTSSSGKATSVARSGWTGQVRRTSGGAGAGARAHAVSAITVHRDLDGADGLERVERELARVRRELSSAPTGTDTVMAEVAS